MATTTSHHRQPDPAAVEEKRNGFREFGLPIDKDDPDDITLRNVRYAQYMLATKGSYVPSYVLTSSPSLSVFECHPGPIHCESWANPRHHPRRRLIASLRKSKSSRNSIQRILRTCSGSSYRNATRNSSTIASVTTCRRTWTSTRRTLTKSSSGRQFR